MPVTFELNRGRVARIVFYRPLMKYVLTVASAEMTCIFYAERSVKAANHTQALVWAKKEVLSL